MKTPITATKSNYFIVTSYSVEGIFKSRNIPSALQPFINDEEEDIEKPGDIINQLIGFLYIETINNSDIEFNQKHIYLNSVKNYSNELDYDISLFDLDMNAFSEIISIAEKHLISIIDEKNKKNVIDTWNSIKSDLLVSILLIFNDFNVKAYIPGSLSVSNADSNSNDTLLWNIDINDINGNDYDIKASSRVFHKGRILLVALMMMIFILGFVVIWIKSD